MEKSGNKIKTLKGHSGCNIYLLKSGSEIIVRKVSSSVKYNFRLKKQCKKQQLFNSSSYVCTPKIVDLGYIGDLFYFDMEFINGKTLAEYTQNIKMNEISDLIKKLFDYLYMKKENKDFNNSVIFAKKIADLKAQLKNIEAVKPAIQILEKFDWKYVYKSSCHGDLTLENILVLPSGGGIPVLYLIDFLDSFFNSQLIDIAKLLQDIEYKWSFRNINIDANRSLRLQIAKECIIEKVLEMPCGQEYINTVYHLLLLNFVRIYPYTKDNDTLIFLNNCVKNLVEKLNKIGEGI